MVMSVVAVGVMVVEAVEKIFLHQTFILQTLICRTPPPRCVFRAAVCPVTVPRGVWDIPPVGSLFANRQHVYDVPDNSTIIAAQP